MSEFKTNPEQEKLVRLVASMSVDCLNEFVHCISWSWRATGQIEADIAHSIFAVHELRSSQFSGQWFRSACIDGHCCPTKLRCVQRILQSHVERYIPCDNRKPYDFNVRVHESHD